MSWCVRAADLPWDLFNCWGRAGGLWRMLSAAAGGHGLFWADFPFVCFIITPGEREMVLWWGEENWDGNGERRAGTDGARDWSVGS